MLATVRTARYVTPLREGGSLPGIVEADDGGMYVVKLRGAGQGQRALVAEILAGELARALGLPVPRLVLCQLDPALGKNEPDYELRHLLGASAGLNVGVEFLPGAMGFDPLAPSAFEPDLAARVVWFDALVTNIDRTVKNPNILLARRTPWLIDHGAALYFHHDWAGYLDKARSPFPAIAQHVLLPRAGPIAEAAATLRPLLTDAVLRDVVALVPSEWLGDEPLFPSVEAHRTAYLDYLHARLQSEAFVEEAERARRGL